MYFYFCKYNIIFLIFKINIGLFNSRETHFKTMTNEIEKSMTAFSKAVMDIR